MRRAALLCLFVVSFLVAANGFAATTWYVSVGGMDTNPGTSGSPYRTITKAMTVALSGDTILVLPGTYAAGAAGAGETFPIAMKSGVVLKSTNGPLMTIVDATAASPRARVFECSGNAVGTTIQGLTITGGLNQPGPQDSSVASGGGIFCDSNDNTLISGNIIK